MSDDSRIRSEATEKAAMRFTTGHFSADLTLVYEGGEAVVYSTESDLHGKLCVKVFTRPSIKNAEIQTLIQHQSHINIVRFLGFFESADKFCSGYVMEYMQNGSLFGIIHNPSIKYDERQVYSWILQASRGIEYLHQNNVLHRDIKPRNFLIGETINILKVGDFGTAKQNVMGMTVTSRSGTYLYMAPEVINSDSVKYDTASDVYSFAFSIWEMLHRKVPFYEYEKISNNDLCNKIVSGVRPGIELSLEEGLKNLIVTGWDKNPEKRPTINEFLAIAKTPPQYPLEIFFDENSIGHCLKKTTNILLLGQSGVGKSTFLNAFGNYLEFGNNFERAEQNLKVYISAQYDLAYNESNREPLTVTLKSSDGYVDGNEVFEEGKCATQEARCYTYQYGSGANQKEVRIIDTPGLGDVDGMEKDQLNIARILKCIKQFETLQAIVFLLRHDETRAMASLKYNLSELLKRLHHDAAKNILFVFPKSDLLKPPSTIKVLNEFFVKINANSKVKIIMNVKTTVFRLDNFGFLYLGGRKYANYQEMGQIRQKAMTCWDYAASEVEYLLKAISALPDYPIQKTLEIQDTKICLEACARPMADLSHQILNNQMKLREKEVEINQLLRENKSLFGRLNCDQTIYVRRPIDTPRLCCYSDTCSTALSASDHLPRICHDSCNCIPEDDKDQETGKALLACVKFDKLDGRCTTCNCGLNTHRMVNFDLHESTITVVNEAVTDTAKANLTERERAVMKCTELRSKNLILEQSLEKLRKTGALFAAFIKLNSLHGDYDDSFEQQLKQCIEVARNSNDKKTFKNLKKFKERYNQEKTMFDMYYSQESSISYGEMLRVLRELEQDESIGHLVQEYTKMIGIYTEEDVPEEKKATINSIFDRHC